MPRTALITLLISLCIAAGASTVAAAETIRIAPDPCPAPADIAPLVSDDVGTYDLNPWAGRFADELLFRDIPVAGGAAVLRLFIDPVTGDILDEPRAPDACADDPGWSQ